MKITDVAVQVIDAGKTMIFADRLMGLGFGQAAKACHVTQSTLSASIKDWGPRPRHDFVVLF